jgi:hypothetical protein
VIEGLATDFKMAAGLNVTSNIVGDLRCETAGFTRLLRNSLNVFILNDFYTRQKTEQLQHT